MHFSLLLNKSSIGEMLCGIPQLQKYSKQKDALASVAAMQLCMIGDANGNAISYLDAMKMEINHQEALQVIN